MSSPQPLGSGLASSRGTRLHDISGRRDPVSGRGKQLTTGEQAALIELYKERQCYTTVAEHPKSFWVALSAHFFDRTQRAYSWQSCRRRLEVHEAHTKEHQQNPRLSAGPSPEQEIPGNVPPISEYSHHSSEEDQHTSPDIEETCSQKPQPALRQQALELVGSPRRSHRSVERRTRKTSYPDSEGPSPRLDGFTRSSRPFDRPPSQSRSRSPHSRGSATYRRRFSTTSREESVPKPLHPKNQMSALRTTTARRQHEKMPSNDVSVPNVSGFSTPAKQRSRGNPRPTSTLFELASTTAKPSPNLEDLIRSYGSQSGDSDDDLPDTPVPPTHRPLQQSTKPSHAQLEDLYQRLTSAFHNETKKFIAQSNTPRNKRFSWKLQPMPSLLTWNGRRLSSGV
ncbi:hypothetical protein NUU61_001052 [Penicillium alfredii]|uniref:Uncharacterized protein n=1 Tax=Penicillium alfredii TaxID=1506179 RepID=A0A9W9GB94_9EURO|nr:uncharacterized protein NUU61_001052 [Penicillium alfredii]KAJ5115293.1 hypothetical protein NUU61_001052 [Penicillium alfredii]